MSTKPAKKAKAKAAPAKKTVKPVKRAAPSPKKKAAPAPMAKKTKSPAVKAPAKSAPTKKHTVVMKQTQPTKPAQPAKADAPAKMKSFIPESQLIADREERAFKFSGDKKKFYDLLVKIRNELTNQIEILADDALKSTKDSGGDLSAMSTHMADRGSDYFLRSMELDMITNESEVIEMIEEAIQRLLNDEFGSCLDCGHKITKARLEALPYARYCIDCKSIREQHGGLRPDFQD